MSKDKKPLKSENVVPMKKPVSSKKKADKVSAAAKTEKKKEKKVVSSSSSAKAKAESKAVSPNVPGTTPVVKASAEKTLKKPSVSAASRSVKQPTSSDDTATKQPKKAIKKSVKAKSKPVSKVKKNTESKSKKTAASVQAKQSTPKQQPQANILKFQHMEETMTKNTQQFDAYTKEAAEMGRQGFDAAMKSSSIWAKGMEEIIRTSVALAQSAAEKQASYAKEAMSSKTINEWSELQSKMAQSSFDDFMEGATKISEMAVKTLTDASEPVNEQVNKAVNAVQKAAA